MKKVLFVATMVKTHIMEFHIPYLKMLQEDGWETAVAAKNDYENPEECHIPYCDYYFDIPFERSPIKKEKIIAYRKLKAIIEKGKFSVVHCHTPVGAALTRLSAMKMRRNGLKVIYTAHGFHFFKGAPVINWLFYYTIEKILAHYTDVLITINKEDYDRAERKFKIKHIIYVPGIGVDTSKFANEMSSDETFRKKTNIKKEYLWLVSVGELNKNKNHIAVIKALAQISNKKIFYTIIGDGANRDWLNKKIEFYRLQDRVYLTGYRDDVSSFYKSADAFIFPSLREGLSLALMEAMASSLPVLCSKIRGNVDLIDECGGVFFDPQNIESIQSAIIQISNLTSEERDKMGRYNSSKIQSYDLSITLKKINDIYRKIMEGEW